MCGIAALFCLKSEQNLNKMIVDMTRLQKHRGPDDEGSAIFDGKGKVSIFSGKDTPKSVVSSPISYCPNREALRPVSGCAALGHRRLSILDLSPAGHQPMSSSDGRYWIVYNGEVYNYKEIREDLEKQGVAFHSNTDTEVILSAYVCWGEKAFQRFNGMFSFVIFDKETQDFIAVRDRFGVKPLYYWTSPDGLIAIASEIKAFTGLPHWNARSNPHIAADFLHFGLIDHSKETFFSDVKQLRGGEYLKGSVFGSNLSVNRWYSLEAKSFAGTFDDAAEFFKELMTDSVRLRLRSDVEVGSCLSGGLDSSTIVCLIHSALDHKSIKTVSAYSEQKELDESRFIKLLVDELKVDSYSVIPHPDMLEELLPKITWHQDEPFGSTSIYAQWLVFEEAKRSQLKVMLDGQGADEQLGGYLGFMKHRYYDLLSTGRLGGFIRELIGTRKYHPSSYSMSRYMKFFSSYLLKRILPPRALSLVRDQRQAPLFADTVVPSKYLDHLPSKRFNDQSYLQLIHSSLPGLLHYEDRDSMAHSIESRVPFLDYRLVEFLLGLSSDQKINGGITKYVMREGMKGVLPEQIRNRHDKIGFATAEELWLKQRRPDLFRRWVQEAVDSSYGLINSNVCNLVDQVISGQKPFDFTVWRIISFGQWMKTFDVKI